MIITSHGNGVDDMITEDELNRRIAKSQAEYAAWQEASTKFFRLREAYRKALSHGTATERQRLEVVAAKEACGYDY